MESSPPPPAPPGSAERRFPGIGVSSGIARAWAVVSITRFEEPERRSIAAEGIETEIARFEGALAATRREIRELHARVLAEVGDDDARIFEAHLMMLDDRAVLDEVVRKIAEEKVSAAWAFYAVVRRFMDSLGRIDDPYLRERVVDIQDVARRVIGHLSVESSPRPEADFIHVVLAHDLTPGDTALMDRTRVLGFATEIGGQTSHTAILARSLSLPAVVGVPHLCRDVRHGEEVVIDGYNGLVIASPAPTTIAFYERLERSKHDLEVRLEAIRDTKCRTSDGRDIILSANIELEEEVTQLESVGAEGIGLYRTEFLYLNQPKHPDEDEQAAIYGRVAEAAGPDGVLIRTFDLGGDKLDPLLFELEPNPFLGWRGIRLSLGERAFFKTQLRAILRASVRGRVGVMFPLISGLAELEAANAVLAECMAELKLEGVPFDAEIEVGAMIEVPSAAVTADLLAPHVDFFSIGTNDLIQYTIAVDRVNERVANLYQPTHPAIVRLLRQIVGTAKKHGIWAGVCGEMAGEVLYAPLMVGVGIDELSVGGRQLPRVKHAIQQLDYEECAALVVEVSALATAEDIFARCREMAEKRYPELL